MRKVVALVVFAVAGFGCQPKVLILNVVPSSVAAGPATVTVNWKLSAGDGQMSADQPVTPSLNPPKKVNTEGSLVEQVCKTTTFKLEPHYGGERTTTVTVATPCDQVNCSQQILNFTGTCFSALQGPTYTTQTASAAIVGNGNLGTLFNFANFPVHVFKDGKEIALGAGGGPIITPIPTVLAAGSYSIIVPGQAGLDLCAQATGPTGGGQADAPPVQLTVMPACAMK